MKIKRFPHFYKIGIRYPKTVLVLSFCLTLLSIFIAKNLQIEVNMTAMAHRQSESVQAFNKYKQYFGGAAYLIVTVEGKDPDLVGQFSEEFARRVEESPLVLYVNYPHPIDYFKKRQWLYLDLEDLKEMERRLDRSIELEKMKVSAVFNDLMDFSDEENRPDLTFKDILKKYDEKWWRSPRGDSENSLMVLRIKVKDEAESINTARALIQKIQEIEADIKQKSEYANLKVGYTGPLETTLEEADQTTHEMIWVSSLVALVLVFIILIYFRRFAPVYLIGLPLGAGILWTGGLVYLFLGHLNLLTSFAGGILAGLGSDYGIYLLTRYYSERKMGKDFQTACKLTFENTGSATYASMLTTVGAFAALIFSRFGVFFELGLLGALGILLNYLAMVLVLPSLLVYVNRWKPIPFSTISPEKPDSFWTSKIFFKYPWRVVIVTLLLCVLASGSLPNESKIHFEEDMMVNQNLPGNRLYKKMSDATTRSLSPTILMVKGFEEETKTVSALENFLTDDQTHKMVYKNVVGLSSFIPKQQQTKKEMLTKIDSKFNRLRLLNKDEKVILIANLKDSLRAEPITKSDLPQEVKRLFESSKENDFYAVYLLPAFTRLSAKDLQHYHEGILDLKSSTELPFEAADSTFVYDDIVKMIEQEAPRGMVIIWIFLGLVLYGVSHSITRMWITLANLFGSLVLLSGVLWVAHISLNVMNIATIPIILGTGIDCFIHFAQRYDESKNIKIALKEKNPAIIVSNLTTIVGFAGLLFTSNPGLRSVGWVAVLGLVVVTLLCVFVFPRCLLLESEKKLKLQKA